MENNKIDKVIEVVFMVVGRILFFIPFFTLALAGVLILFLKFIINYVRFGGEAISYTAENRRKKISDIYDIISKEYQDKQQ